MEEIKVQLTTTPKQKPTDETKLGFGKIFTDHMFVMDYTDGHWHDPRIVPYGPLDLTPACMCLHYSQEVFEGMKAYRGVDGKNRRRFPLHPSLHHRHRGRAGRAHLHRV